MPIAITMGDAAGIGPEIIVGALTGDDPFPDAVVVGDAERLRRAAAVLGVEVDVVAVERPGDAVPEGAIACIDLGGIDADLPFGELSAQAGEGAYRAVERAVALAQAGEVDAICTAPLNKEALHLAGHRYPGHTELLAELTGVTDYAMMLTTPKLRVIHVTTHIGLIDAVAAIDPARVERVIRLGHAALSARRGSRSAASTRTPARTASSATARRRRRSSPPSRRRSPTASTCRARCRPTPRSSAPCAATSTSSSRCTTTRATARSRCSASTRASTSRSACP